MLYRFSEGLYLEQAYPIWDFIPNILQPKGFVLEGLYMFITITQMLEELKSYAHNSDDFISAIDDIKYGIIQDLYHAEKAKVDYECEYLNDTQNLIDIAENDIYWDFPNDYEKIEKAVEKIENKISDWIEDIHENAIYDEKDFY